MSTTVEILTNTKQNILTIPILAVTTRIDTLKKVEEWEKVEERTEPSNSEP
jgi:predicted GTPase